VTGAAVNEDRSAEKANRRWRADSLLGTLPVADREALLATGSAAVFQPGEFLTVEGGAERDVIVLVSGWVKAVSNTSDGRTVLLSIRTAGELVGELAALDDHPRSASVIAATRVDARVIGQRAFLAFLGQRPAVSLAVSRSIAAKIRMINRHRIDISGVSVLRRVARVLVYLAEQHATPSADGLLIDVPLSRTELAALVGAAEPSLYRALGYLRDHQVLLTRHRRQVILDFAALERISRDEGREPEADANSN
jgi:CRP/FNR family transcriptional regulator, cyclic AMP receptor protein